MPMVKRTYSITETPGQNVNDRVGSGEYASDSEYLRELVRPDQNENKEIAYIRSKLIKAEQNRFTDKNKDQILAEIKERAKSNGKLQPFE
ncbi:MAG: CopG family transcriptional regulator [Candidatus Thiodiazotropha taylori]|nr:CopG family transcriptional regulator [Candidatus Thiodiazotropha endolucinida]MCW4229647.1 CopG family transcriptional regulator [Candidatus Thiodiazotropha taylori]